MSLNSISPTLTHLDASGEARMVDVGGKAITAREAIAEARVRLGPVAFAAVRDATIGKGDVLGTARIAGIMAAKRCADLIPLCHSLPLAFVGVEFEFEPNDHGVRVKATCRTDHKTGVEMEAMTAASVAALTLYDMCKGVDKAIVIEGVRLLYKSGGKSGVWQAQEPVVTPPGVLKPEPAEQDASTSQTPSASLVFFARVAELAACRQDRYRGPWPVNGGQLLHWLEQRYPALAPTSRLQLAINQQHAKVSDPIGPGDEVAVFEPVTGG